MISYVTVGSNDLEKAKGFYDLVLAELGGKRTMTMDRFQGYGSESSPGMFAVCKPYDVNPATVGNGAMFALFAPSRDVVDKTYAVAMANGGADEGPPDCAATLSTPPIRDLDGNKLCVFNMG